MPEKKYLLLICIFIIDTELSNSKIFNLFQSYEDPYYPTINGVIEKVTGELKYILKKDFNKKMIENTAFKNFELWWDEQVRGKNSENKLKDGIVKTAQSERENIMPLQDISNKKDEKIDTFKSILDSTRDLNLDLGGYGLMGLGLRAAIPKMPSFRRKRMIPSPVVLDEDSSSKRLSDQVNLFICFAVAYYNYSMISNIYCIDFGLIVGRDSSKFGYRKRYT